MIKGLSFDSMNASDKSGYIENCAAFVHSNMSQYAGKVDDRECEDQYSFICEIKSGNIIQSSAPVGTITSWLRHIGSDSEEQQIPNCWSKCDGSIITNPKSPWKG